MVYVHIVTTNMKAIRGKVEVSTQFLWLKYIHKATTLSNDAVKYNSINIVFANRDLVVSNFVKDTNE